MAVDETTRMTHDTTEAKLALARGAERRGRIADGRGGRREAACARQAARARARRAAARPGIVRRARPLRAPPRGGVRHARQAPVGRRGRDRVRHRVRPADLRVLAGFHRVRRVAERGVRREDLQGDGHGRQGRLPRRRDQRLGRGADPGGRRLARGLRRDLLAERPGVGRDPADLAHPRAVRRRRRLLARDHGLRADGRGHVVHVHHRPRRREDRHRRGRDAGGARRRGGPCVALRRCPSRRGGRGSGARRRALPALVPAPEQPRAAAVRRPGRPGRARGARARHAHPGLAQQAVRHQARHSRGRRRRRLHGAPGRLRPEHRLRLRAARRATRSGSSATSRTRSPACSTSTLR